MFYLAIAYPNSLSEGVGKDEGERANGGGTSSAPAIWCGSLRSLGVQGRRGGKNHSRNSRGQASEVRLP